jgi:hypothetical protein
VVVIGLCAAAAGAHARPLEGVSYWNGVLGASGEFRTVFDNTEYSHVRLPKLDERTYFFSDLTLYADFRVAEGIMVQAGGKVRYDFGDDAGDGPGPQAYLRLRGTIDTERHHWTFGHFREYVSPLTFVQRDYDDELAGMRYRLTWGPSDSRLFLARTSTAGEERYETFAGGGRMSLRPWEKTVLGANLGGIHEGGFDAGGGSPPPGGRTRESGVGSLDFEQGIPWGFFGAGEAALSVDRGDREGKALRDNAFWLGGGWRRGPFELSGRLYRVGWAFATPWGVRFLRNEEGSIILSDFYAWTARGAASFNLFDTGTLTLALEGGVKYKEENFAEQDYNFNIELIRFEVFL